MLQVEKIIQLVDVAPMAVAIATLQSALFLYC